VSGPFLCAYAGARLFRNLFSKKAMPRLIIEQSLFAFLYMNNFTTFLPTIWWSLRVVK